MNTNNTNNKAHKIYQLSKLNTQREEQKNSILKDFEKIVNFVQLVKEVNTKNVTPLKHPYNIKNQLREDIEDSSLYIQREKLEQISPQFESGFFIVNKVI